MPDIQVSLTPSHQKKRKKQEKKSVVGGLTRFHQEQRPLISIVRALGSAVPRMELSGHGHGVSDEVLGEDEEREGCMRATVAMRPVMV